MEKIKLGVFFISVFFLFSSMSNITALVSPGPDCYIKGEINNVEFKEAYKHECLVNNSKECPVGGYLSQPDRYVLIISIEEFSTKSSFGKETCEDYFKKIREPHSKLNLSDIRFVVPKSVLDSSENDSLTPGVNVEGTVNEVNRKKFDSFNVVEPGEKSDEYNSLTIGILLLVIFALIVYLTIKRKKWFK